MLKNLTIRGKMALLAGISVIVLLAIAAGGVFFWRTLTSELDSATALGRDATEAVAQVREAHVNFQRQVQEWKNVLIRGNEADAYARHFKAFEARANDVQNELKAAEAAVARIGVSPGLVTQLRRDHAEMLDKYLAALKTFDATDPETGKKVDRLIRGVDRATSANFDKLVDAVVANADAALKSREEAAQRASRLALIGGLVGAVATLLLILFAYRMTRRITIDIRQLAGVVGELNQGNLDARADVKGGDRDELASLGAALNTLLDEKVAELARAQKENDQLNNSVIEILMSVAQLAQRDLDVKVPVSEDVTGAVSDAINMMSTSTARALREVNTISTQVSDSSVRVKARADSVLRLAGEASDQASAASAELGNTADALRQIGDQAQDAGREAERALTATAEAMSVVRATVDGITSSRDRIRETEKRVKRLAERSQEISSAVTIIGRIAERTSVLALNASMQAVAAGEAGRGFAAVADEVKRLAENAREATQQIAGLVGAIQSDTTETLQAMNGTIAQVVDITRLADQAGTQMGDTRAATEALVNSVRGISQATRTQAETSQRLLVRANQLIDASQRTLEEIEQQRGDTESLNASATALVKTVGGFKLPANL